MIRVSHLSKYYGELPAVEDLSFEIEDGHVYGFLGPNGAGKSTTMNIITGCLSPTEGTVSVCGFDILEQPNQAKKCIGYLPELPPLYLNETTDEYLAFVGEAKGLRGKELRRQIDKAVESTRLNSVRHRLIGTLSKGYRQRVGIAQALLGEPKIIILDEPTVGLDPLQIIEIRDLIRELGQSHTVILSSHILSEVQAICEKVLIIAKGKLVAFDTPENLEKLLTASNAALFQVQTEPAAAEEILNTVEGIADWQISETGEGILSVEAHFRENTDSQTVCGQISLAFAAQGLPLLEMRRKKANLEDVFLELTDEDSVTPSAGDENTDDEEAETE